MAIKGTRNTTISFGGFEIAVSMKKAHGSRDLKTEIVNGQGEKVKTVGGGGRRSPRDGEARAVRLSDDHVVRLPQVELDRIEQRSQERWGQMQVLETIDYRQVPTERIIGSYWLQPAQGSAKTLRLLVEALRKTGLVAVVKWCATSREKLGVLRVRGSEGRRALLLSELAFANDFLAPDEDALEINNVAVDDRSVQVAVTLVKSFQRQRGASPRVDDASDEAVDARLALFKLLCDKQTEQQLEESVGHAQAEAEVVDLDAARRVA